MIAWFIEFFNIDVVVNVMNAFGVSLLIMLGWLWCIRYMNTGVKEFLLLSGVFFVHASSMIFFSLHRYVHAPWIRAVYRPLMILVEVLIIYILIRYRHRFLGRET